MGGVVAGPRAKVGRRADALVAVALAGVFAASALWHPPAEGGFVLCPFRLLTGLPCAGCGLTRSFCALAKGDWAASYGFHPLGPALFVAAVVYWARSLVALGGRSALVSGFDRAVRRGRVAIVAVFLFAAAWVVELVALGASGRLAALAREGLLYRLLGGG